MTASPHSTVCVLGLGLIGGSLLQATVRRGRTAFGYNRSEAGAAAARADGFDADTDLDAVLRRAAADDALIVVSTPVTTLDELLPTIARLAPGCVLTDVISVKGAVAAAVARHHPDARYVGGHPMAGTSQSGWSAAGPDLFAGAMWMLTTEDHTDPAAWRAVAALARGCGAQVVPAANDAHDRAVAAISHLPHLTANATAAVGAAESGLALRLAAGSFRDGTRVAGTAPALQRAMLEANRIALLNTLSETIDRLVAARDDLRDSGSVEIIVDDGHRARLAYEAMATTPVPPIVGIEPGEADWAAQMRRQGHLGRTWQR